MIKAQNNSSSTNLLFILILLLVSFILALASVFHGELVITSVGLIIGGGIAVLVCTRWPESFAILAVWTNFLKSAYIPGLVVGEFGATPYMIFTALAAFGFSVQIFLGKRRLILFPGFWFFLLFIGFTTLSLAIVQDFRLAIGAYTRTLLDWILCFLLVQMVVEQQRVQQLIRALLIQALIVAGWGIASGIQRELTGVGWQSIFFWQQYQKNDFAAYLGIVLVLALATFSLSNSRATKVASAILMVAVPIGWLITFSRGGFLAIVTCLLVFLVLERNRKLLQRSFLATFVIGLLSLLILVLAPTNVRELALDGLQSLATGESEAARHIDTIEIRLELIQAGTQVIAAKPLLGVGFNQWQFYSPITVRVYDPQAGEFRQTGYSIHNRYLLIAANSGLVALFFYLSFLGTVLINAFYQRRFANTWIRTYLHVFIAAVLGMQVALLFAPSVTWEWPTLGILIGIVNVAKFKRRISSQETNAPAQTT